MCDKKVIQWSLSCEINNIVGIFFIFWPFLWRFFSTLPNNFEWLDRVENLMSDDKRDLVYDTEELVYSEEDKAKIEASLSNEEFLTLMKIKHSLFNRWNRKNQAVNPRTRMVKQQEVAKSCSLETRSEFYTASQRKRTGRKELWRNHATGRAKIRTQKNNSRK